MKARFAVDNNENDFALCENAQLDDAIIVVNQELYRHFDNSRAKNVSPAIKDKKELREKLEKRGRDIDTIERYLSFSSLPD